MPLEEVSTGDPHVSAHNEEREAINTLETGLGTKITAPANPKVGDILRFDGSAWGLSDLRHFEGTGAPEGQVAAPIGSRYRDTAGTNGAVEWIKVSGLPTSNTGWMLIAGDTGWRTINSLISVRSTGTVHTAKLRRVNNTVDFFVDLTMPNNTSSPYTIMTLPVGFQPDFTREGLLQDNREGASTSTSVLGDGSVNLLSITAGKRDRWNGIWTTTDPWPDTLPGT